MVYAAKRSTFTRANRINFVEGRLTGESVERQLFRDPVARRSLFVAAADAAAAAAGAADVI